MSETVEIALNKILDISYAKEFHSMLTKYSEALAESSALTLDFKETALITTPCMQLIYSFLELAGEHNLETKITGISEELKKDIIMLGFQDAILEEHT